MDAEGTVRQIPEGYEVIFERLLPHVPARVWAMLTEPEHIETWFCARVELDARPGGRMIEHHDHVGMDVLGEVSRWEPNRVFEHSWWFENQQQVPRDTVKWELFPVQSGTRLVLTDRRRSLDGAEGAMAGRQICLDILADVLNGADPSTHAPPRGGFQAGQFRQSHPGRGRWADTEKLTQEYKEHFARARRQI